MAASQLRGEVPVTNASIHKGAWETYNRSTFIYPCRRDSAMYLRPLPKSAAWVLSAGQLHRPHTAGGGCCRAESRSTGGPTQRAWIVHDQMEYADSHSKNATFLLPVDMSRPPCTSTALSAWSVHTLTPAMNNAWNIACPLEGLSTASISSPLFLGVCV